MPVVTRALAEARGNNSNHDKWRQIKLRQIYGITVADYLMAVNIRNNNGPYNGGKFDL